jgi:hypothetical protein
MTNFVAPPDHARVFLFAVPGKRNHPLPCQVIASMLMVIVETAAAALEKMAELLELGHANVLVKDLDSQLVGNARLENEAASRTP